MEIRIENPASIDKGAREFLAALPDEVRLIDFSGPMGAGKTTFISAICRVLGVVDDVNSPTFSIVNEYVIPSAGGKEHIYHFDFYRLDSAEQAMEIGAEDYFYSGARCFMEWAENVGSIIPEETLKVLISVNADGSRTVSF